MSTEPSKQTPFVVVLKPYTPLWVNDRIERTLMEKVARRWRWWFYDDDDDVMMVAVVTM
ncbi:hypothetical protein Tco_1147188, partial [Tanacetum coccineum]